jgi:glycosyltransferase involved in cell wall biosynthesis
MRVLFVSKPIAPPFHDGSQILVKEIASALPTFRARVCTVRGPNDWAKNLGLDTLAVYSRSGGFAPALIDNARVGAALLADDASDLWHFVFAPNPRSCAMARAIKLLRRIPMVQTVASPPRSFESIDNLLFGDVVVVQSEWTKRRLLSRLTRERPIALVRPPLGRSEPPTLEAQHAVRSRLRVGPTTRLIVYPGDLEFSQGAERFARAAQRLEGYPDVVFVWACRKKTPRAAAVEAALARRLDPRRVRFAGELPSLLPLLATASVVAFPVEELFAKVDIPIALLEAMDLGIPLVVSDSGPVSELRGPLAIPANSTEALLGGVTRLLDTPELARAVVQMQKEHIENEFRSKVVAGRYEALYHGLCAN